MKRSVVIFFLFFIISCSAFFMGELSAVGETSDAATNSNQQEVQALQEQMMANQNVMALIYLLQQDPSFQEAMREPEIMEAINKGDFTKLSTNPKFMELLNDPRVQEINNELSQ